MKSLNENVHEYIIQLKKGSIQKAYKGIMSFMNTFKVYLGKKYPDYVVSSLYFGHMDMTYFAFTPTPLKKLKLKIAIVFLHEENRFEVWLSGNNKKIQANYIKDFTHKNLGEYKISKGEDSIIESIIVKEPNFDNLEELKIQLEEKVIVFINEMLNILLQE